MRTEMEMLSLWKKASRGGCPRINGSCFICPQYGRFIAHVRIRAYQVHLNLTSEHLEISGKNKKSYPSQVSRKVEKCQGISNIFGRDLKGILLECKKQRKTK